MQLLWESVTMEAASRISIRARAQDNLFWKENQTWNCAHIWHAARWKKITTAFVYNYTEHVLVRTALFLGSTFLTVKAYLAAMVAVSK